MRRHLAAQHRSTVLRSAILRRAEVHLREAGRSLKLSIDPEQQRLAKVAFRLAQRIAVDAGRLVAA